MSKVSHKIRNKMEMIGTCDRTGFNYNYSDLVKQLDYRGNSLTWTGLMVGRDQVDDPNYQNKPYQAKPESIPPVNARPLVIPGIPAFYGPTLSSQEALQNLIDSMR